MFCKDLTKCTNAFNLVKQLMPCYNNLRSIYRRYNELKKFVKWQKLWKQCNSKLDYNLLCQLADSQHLNKDMQNELINMVEYSRIYHSEINVIENYGHLIKIFQNSLLELEAYPCQICNILNYKKNVILIQF